MQVVRTPDEQFENLPGYPFAPHYRVVTDAEGNSVRMHYVDEGEGDDLVLLLHGQPSWSYLYRKMIPLISAKARVVAPDLIGFGRSDKPVNHSDYTYSRHTSWMISFIEFLLSGEEKKAPQRLILFCQDWGGLIGLRIAGLHPDYFSAIIAANTGLPIGGQKMDESWYAFKKFCIEAKRLPFGRLIQAGCVSTLSLEVKKAYAAPFPTEEHCGGPRTFPGLIPFEKDDPEARINQKALEGLRNFHKPFVTSFSDSDPITAKGDLLMRRFFPGAKLHNLHTTIRQGGHFLQEDQPEACAGVVAKALAL